MTVIIDRFEGKIAVLELPDGSFINAPAVLFPFAEGDVVNISLDGESTAQRKSAASAFLDSIISD